jgi:hypothetical protein
MVYQVFSILDIHYPTQQAQEFGLIIYRTRVPWALRFIQWVLLQWRNSFWICEDVVKINGFERLPEYRKPVQGGNLTCTLSLTRHYRSSLVALLTWRKAFGYTWRLETDGLSLCSLFLRDLSFRLLCLVKAWRKNEALLSLRIFQMTGSTLLPSFILPGTLPLMFVVKHGFWLNFSSEWDALNTAINDLSLLEMVLPILGQESRRFSGRMCADTGILLDTVSVYRRYGRGWWTSWAWLPGAQFYLASELATDYSGTLLYGQSR